MRWRLAFAAVVLALVACRSEPEPVMPAEPVKTPTPKTRRAAASPVAGQGRSEPLTSPALRALASASPRATPPAAATAAPTATPSPMVKPSPSPRTTTVASDPASEELRQLVERWRSAWQRKELPVYLAFYAPSFEGDGKSLAQWSEHKKGVFGRVGPIQIGVTELDVKVSGNRATVEFTQSYAVGAGQGDRGRKTLELERGEAGWLIVRERFQKAR